MSAMGHEQTSRHVRVMSVIPLKADIHQRECACPLSAISGLGDRLSALSASIGHPRRTQGTWRVGTKAGSYVPGETKCGLMRIESERLR